MAKNMRGQGRDRVFEVLKSIIVDLTAIRAELVDIKAKHDEHRHAAAGAAAAANTGPSTAAGTSAAVQSSVGAIAALTTTSE